MGISETDHKKYILIQMLQRGYEEQLCYLSRLTPVEKEATGTTNNWAPKDVMAHIVEWQRRMANHLIDYRRGEDSQAVLDIDTENAAIIKHYRRVPWETLLKVMESTHKALADELQRLSEADLVESPRYAWQRGTPLWRNLAGNVYLHVLSHMLPYYLKHGDKAYAMQISEEQARLTTSLDEAPTWQGIAQYNLACIYALMGEKKLALERLEIALTLHPGLIEWSKGDGDLASLHNDRDFKALTHRLESTPQHVFTQLDRDLLIRALTITLEHLMPVFSHYEYRLVGTGAALLHGVSLPANDIDLLMKDRQAVDAFSEAMSGFRCLSAPTWLPDRRQYYAAYEVEGVEVGASTVEIENDSDCIETFGRGPWEHYSNLQCGPYQVPTIRLELRLITELARRRQERIEPLVRYLKTHDCEKDFIQRAMQEIEIDQQTQKDILAKI